MLDPRQHLQQRRQRADSGACGTKAIGGLGKGTSGSRGGWGDKSTAESSASARRAAPWHDRQLTVEGALLLRTRGFSKA